MAIQWSTTMSTGVAELDEEHRQLIECINTLTAAMKSGNGRQEVLEILTFLNRYAEEHFTHEEHCMNRLHCPAAKANRKAHSDFLYMVSEMRERVEREGPTWLSMMQLNASLGEWLRSHILHVDARLRNCVPKTDPFDRN